MPPKPKTVASSSPDTATSAPAEKNTTKKDTTMNDDVDEDGEPQDEDEDEYYNDEDEDDEENDEDDEEYQSHRHAWEGLNEWHTLEMQQYAEDDDEDPFNYIDDDDFWGDNDSWMFECDVIDIKTIVQPRFIARKKMFEVFCKDRETYIRNNANSTKPKVDQPTELAEWNSFTSQTKNKTNRPPESVKNKKKSDKKQAKNEDEDDTDDDTDDDDDDTSAQRMAFQSTPDAYHYCAYCDEFTTLIHGKGPDECHDIVKHPKYCFCDKCSNHIDRRARWFTTYTPILARRVRRMAQRHREAEEYERHKEEFFAMSDDEQERMIFGGGDDDDDDDDDEDEEFDEDHEPTDEEIHRRLKKLQKKEPQMFQFLMTMLHKFAEQEGMVESEDDEDDYDDDM